MSGAAKDPSKTSRLSDSAAGQAERRFPLGLSGFGQRWSDRQFQAEDALAELLELVSDLPSLRVSARELVDIWLASGKIDEDEASRMRQSINTHDRSLHLDEDDVTERSTEPGLLTPDPITSPAFYKPEGTLAERLDPDTTRRTPSVDPPQHEGDRKPAVQPGVSCDREAPSRSVTRQHNVLRVLSILFVAAGLATVASYFWLGKERFRAGADRIVGIAGIDIPWPDTSVPEGDGTRVQTPAADDDRKTGGQRQDTVTLQARAADIRVPEKAPSSDGSASAARVSLQLGGRDRRPDVVSVEVVENEGTVAVTLERAEASGALDLGIRPVTNEEGMESLRDLLDADSDTVIRLPAGVVGHTLTIPLPDDDRVTGTRRYGFLIVRSGNDGRTLARVNLTVRDDELIDRAGYLPPGTVAFADESVTVREGAGAAEIRLVRFGGYERERMTRLLVVGRSAKAGEDFMEAARRDVRFAAEQDNVTVFIPIVDDSRLEDMEFFQVMFDDPQGSIGSPSQLIVKVLDDDK